MYVKYINKSQLNNDVKGKEGLQKMQIPLFMFYSKFLCGRHTNPKLLRFYGTLQKVVFTV